MTSKKHRLVSIDWPEFGSADAPRGATPAEYAERLAAARTAMNRWGLTHLVVYADREHFANIAYLTGFDPRFEESLLIIGMEGKPLLVVGNECSGYLTVSPPYVAGDLRTERFQPFSLLGQPRNESRLLRDIFASEGIGPTSNVGCVGWKYFADSEQPDGRHAIDLPSYMADALRDLAGRERVINATAIFMHPGEGLRSFCSPAEIAFFEFTNILGSEGMRRMLFGCRDGMVDFEMAKLVEYNGVPQGCHMTLETGDNRRGLAGPIGATVRRGDPLGTNICYWGSNICRAGWVAESAADLPADARDYVENFAGPYFEVMGEWFGLLRIGTPGDAIDRLIRTKLPFEKFGIFLNAGHLIHLDEWVSSPVYPGSDVRLHSGMAIQVDVIPSSETYFSTRMEDGVVLADADLRRRLKEAYPACFARCQKRREFMAGVLGIELPEEVLPLSNVPAIVPPFFLKPNLVFTLAGG